MALDSQSSTQLPESAQEICVSGCWHLTKRHMDKMVSERAKGGDGLQSKNKIKYI